MMLDGTLCYECGELIGDPGNNFEGEGFPGLCGGCCIEAEDDIEEDEE